MNPDNPPPGLIQVPADWSDDAVLTFEDCCRILRVPQRTARDWRRRHVGPRWHKLEGTGRLYLTVAELRRFLSSTSGPR
ncbi:MAG: hypothetical protein NVSMB48_01730 [Marmoricola sp.]